MSSYEVRVHVDRRYESQSALVRSTLAVLIEQAGWHTRFVDDHRSAQVIYSPEVVFGNPRERVSLHGISPAIWETLYSSGPALLEKDIVPDRALLSSSQAVDPVAWAAFFLTGMHERDRSILESADRWAMPGMKIARWGLNRTPPVHRASLAVKSKLLGVPTIHPPAPRWPAGKSWALSVTHDFDRYRKYRPVDFTRAALSSLASGRLLAVGRELGKAAISVAGLLVQRDPYARSLVEWCEAERSLGIRSAIYVAVVHRNDPRGDSLDVGYTAVNDTELITQVRRLIDEGWEVGLHSSMNAWQTHDGFAVERARFANVFGAEPAGIRAHYWSIDQLDVGESLRRMLRAGFTYDSSLGMNTADGYRRGANYPYRAFDDHTGNPIDLWEVPTVMMDHALWTAAPTPAMRMSVLAERVRESAQNEGLLVLDWHTDSLSSGYMDGTADIVIDSLHMLSRDRSCWIATPAEVVGWLERDRWRLA